MSNSNKDMIFYWPTEGTTGLWGLRDVPEVPKLYRQHPEGRMSAEDGKGQEYMKALESCKEKKLEIVNMDDHGKMGISPYFNGKPIRPGDILDLPIGYEFLELESLPVKLKLVKTETKASIPPPVFMSEILPHAQPEPEESQTWVDIYNLGQKHGVQNYIAILRSEVNGEIEGLKIRRRQLLMVDDRLAVDTVDSNIENLEWVLETIDSVTPKK